MKNWWLKLYTIPSLMVLGKAFFFVLSVILLARFFAPDFLFTCVWGSLYISKSMFDDSKSSMIANVEFHKLHIPYIHLRKALIQDSLIRVSATLVAILICIRCCILGKLDTESLFYLGMVTFINGVFLFQLSNVNKIINGKYRFSIYNKDHHGMFKKLIVSMFTSFMAMFFLMLIMFFDFNPIFVIFFGMVGIFSFTSIFNYRALFHQEKEKGSLKTMWKYYSKGVGAGMAVYFFGMLIARPMITMHDVSSLTKFVAYEYVGPFTPELDIESAKDLLSVAELMQYKVFRDTPGIDQVPVSELYLKPSMKDYLTYLENVDSPTADNLVYMLKKNQGYKGDPKLKSHLSAEIVKKWPKNKTFPEEYLDKKVEVVERLPASTENQK